MTSVKNAVALMRMRLVRVRLGQQRTGDHADRGHEDTGKLRWKRGPQRGGNKNNPGKDPQDDGRNGALAGGALPVKPTDQRNKSADQRNLVCAGDHLIYGGALHDDGVTEYATGKKEKRDTKREQLLLISQAGPQVLINVLDKTR